MPSTAVNGVGAITSLDVNKDVGLRKSSSLHQDRITGQDSGIKRCLAYRKLSFWLVNGECMAII